VKRIGRPKVKDRYREERGVLASLIDNALTAGQRGDGMAKKHWYPWTEVEFARKVGASPSVVGDWRDRAEPARPGNIEPILKVFYGEVPAYTEAKKAMKTAWKRAAGIEEDDPPDTRKIIQRQFSDVAHVVSLLVNQAIPDNHGNLIVPYTLRMHCDEKVEIGVKMDGNPTTVTMDIGLTKPLFLVDSKDWQPLQDTIFRKKNHANIAPGPVGDCVYITGPTDGNGRVIGDPLGDEPNVVMERRGTAEDGPITFSVKAPRDGFRVTVSGPMPSNPVTGHRSRRPRPLTAHSCSPRSSRSSRTAMGRNTPRSLSTAMKMPAKNMRRWDSTTVGERHWINSLPLPRRCRPAEIAQPLPPAKSI